MIPNSTVPPPEVPPHDVPPLIDVTLGDSPLVAVAIHDGHEVRPEVAKQFAISDSDRRREEDAFTSDWTYIAANQVVGLRSRFEVDLNRRRHRAVYLTPDDAWGLTVWKQPPIEELVERSRKLYDQFYGQMFEILDNIRTRHGWFFVYDFHCYNHRRDGPDALAAPLSQNPQINLCTGGMDLDRCEPVIQSFEDAIRSFDFPGGNLDVRRNVRFRATRFSRWVHENFPGTGISLGIEVKKFFMDEWTHQADEELLKALGRAFHSTTAPVQETMQTLQINSTQTS